MDECEMPQLTQCRAYIRGEFEQKLMEFDAGQAELPWWFQRCKWETP